MNEPLERRVRKRALGRSEYCRVPAHIPEFTFPIDHVIAQQHQGTTTYENLALSRPHCNYHKGPNIAGYDPVTGNLTRLFNPRRNRWSAHFGWAGPLLVGKTAIGRQPRRETCGPSDGGVWRPAPNRVKGGFKPARSSHRFRLNSRWRVPPRVITTSISLFRLNRSGSGSVGRSAYGAAVREISASSSPLTRT